ncbi:imm11 family protein [Shewanella algae]|uniref:imm11 family protein n=1 Tax=Shewanella algae TaxID=38313 RepID=UPI001AAF74B2|nr:DUF1629 domain-containing protein [Shewanella algae]MBO2629506.1 hypothetical protein [Shewanella algae]
MMEVAYITEDFNEGNSFFKYEDKRSFFYNKDNDFNPTSISEPIVWKDNDLDHIDALDLIKLGCFNVTKEIAHVIMSFDPYGIVFYPAKLACAGQDTSSGRYLIAVNNIVDVVDKNKSKNISKAMTQHYLSEDKIKSLPPCKQHVFKPKGMNKIFFSKEIFDALQNIYEEGKIKTSLIAYTFDTSEDCPNI